jgi:hypothetical protein
MSTTAGGPLVPDRDRAESTSVRASDAEREAAVRRLHHALGEGRLDLRETETRVAEAYAATYREGLPALLDDLPDDDRSAVLGEAGVPTWRAIWTALVWRARATLWDEPGVRDLPPGPAQQRIAALVIAVAAVWFVVCAVVGALL